MKRLADNEILKDTDINRTLFWRCLNYGFQKFVNDSRN